MRPVGVVWKKDSFERSTRSSMRALRFVPAVRAVTNHPRFRNKDRAMIAAQNAYISTRSAIFSDAFMLQRENIPKKPERFEWMMAQCRKLKQGNLSKRMCKK